MLKIIELVDEYFSAISNETSFDRYFYKEKGAKESDYGYIPRPIAWLAKVSLKKNLVNLIPFVSFLIKLVFASCGFIILYAKDLLVYWNKLVKSTDYTDYCCSSSDRVVGLGFSSNAITIINDNNLFSDGVFWFYAPWVKNEEYESNGLSCLSLLNRKDLSYCFFLSVLACYSSIFVRKRKGLWFLQCYTAFRWFLLRIALSKVDANTFVCVEHFDRWAVLADLLAKEKEEQNKQLCKLIFVQHGILNSLNVDGSYRDVDFPIDLNYKMDMVSDLFVYDKRSEEIFKQNILSVRCANRLVNISHFSSILKLTPLHSAGAKVRLLFVGHPSCIDLQKALYRKIVNEVDVLAYYKPHPTLPIPSTDSSLKWIIIKDKSIYPVVDMLISYPSTLVKEYETHNVDVFVHSMNASLDDINFLSEKIISKIKG